MSFSELPSVLAEDILEMVVATTSSLFEILSMRIVNKFFDHGITKFFARMHMHGSRRSTTTPYRAWIDEIPESFRFRLIRAYLGEGDHRDTHLVSKMHAAVDFLWENLEGDEKPPSRHVLLESVCKALVFNGYHYHIFGHKRPPKPEKGYNVKEKLMHRTCFALASAIGYPNLQKTMLKNGIVKIQDKCQYLGHPLDTAIRFGNRECVSLICERGDQDVDSRTDPIVDATKDAAREGHTLTVLEVLKLWDYSTEDSYGTYSTKTEKRLSRDELGSICNAAADFGRWDIVNHFLDTFTTDMDWIHVMNLASRYGNDGLVRRLIDLSVNPWEWYDTTPRLMAKTHFPPSLTYPLREAVLGGQLKTCELLLQHRASHYLPDIGIATLWHEATTENRFDVFQYLYRQGVLWNNALLGVLPLASEKGSLAIARFAVQERLDRTSLMIESPDKSTEWPLQDCVRFLSLLRGIIRNHINIVSCLISEVGVDISNSPSGWVDLELTPLILAVDAGHLEMVYLLLQSGAEPFEEDSFDLQTSQNYRNARQERLHSMSKRLGFVKGFEGDYIGSQYQVEEAYWAACQRPSSLGRKVIEGCFFEREVSSAILKICSGESVDLRFIHMLKSFNDYGPSDFAQLHLPDAFSVRMIRQYIEDNGRGTIPIVSYIYDVAENLFYMSEKNIFDRNGWVKEVLEAMVVRNESCSSSGDLLGYFERLDDKIMREKSIQTSSFVISIIRKHVDIEKEMIRAPDLVDINAECPYLGNPLKVAAWLGHTGTVERLLDAGAQDATRGGAAKDIAQLAAEGGHLKLIEVLYADWYEISTSIDATTGAIYGAEKNGRFDILNHILDHYQPSRPVRAYWSSARRNPELDLVYRPVNVHLPIGRWLDVKARTSLCEQASARGDIEFVQRMLGSFTRLQSDYAYRSCLGAAIENRHYEICRLYLETFTEWHLRQCKDYYPISHARGGSVEILELCMRHNAKFWYESVMLPIAAECGNLDMVKHLLGRRFHTSTANPKALSYFSLLAAIARNQLDTVRFLYDRIKTIWGVFHEEMAPWNIAGAPLVIAIDSGNQEVAHIILELEGCSIISTLAQVDFSLAGRKARASLFRSYRQRLTNKKLEFPRWSSYIAPQWKVESILKTLYEGTSE
ncbi:hypothetical protein B0J11DRAFT_609740 [Dendryphion nanum]|uniref:Ankyrin repeat protein n=1 Tax=Dendryphion nanum TaxID=256645 RepID=A0A9P9IWG0_9PLEO|nr:hypothetical protein B0J11DRAFT_609740 [Dendryphion nanum]